MPVSVGLQVLFRENIKKPAAGLQIFPWQINKILITGTRCLLMPQDAAFCAVSCGSVLSRAFQNEIHRSAKRGKMRQIEAAKSSRKVVKRDFLLLGFLLPFAPKQIINLLYIRNPAVRWQPSIEFLDVLPRLFRS